MKRGIFPALRLGFVLALILGAMTIPAAADGVADEIANYAQTLADEEWASVGGKLTRGDGSSQYQLNSTTATAGRSLYVMELRTTVSYERIDGPGDNCHMDAALFYLGTDNKVYWTEHFNYNDFSESFMGHTSALVDGQHDDLSIQLPNNVSRILALYFHKEGGPVQGQRPWAASYLRIAKVSGTIGGRGTDTDGYEYRSYGGEYTAWTTNLNELNYNGWGHHLWRLDTASVLRPGGGYYPVAPSITERKKNSCAKSVFLVELITGSDGYTGEKGTVTLNYTDTLGITYEKQMEFSRWYEAMFPGKNVELSGQFEASLNSPWLSQNTKHMQQSALFFTGNCYNYTDTDTKFLPYTSTTFSMVMPQNIDTVNSITVQLDGNDNLALQSVRFYELNSMPGSDTNYWNASFGRERVRPWVGTLLACTEPGNPEVTILGRNNAQFTPSAPGSRKLTSYSRGAGPQVDNSGSGVAVSVKFADELGAGLESLLANPIPTPDATDIYWLSPHIQNNNVSLTTLALLLGKQSFSALVTEQDLSHVIGYTFLNPQVRECLTLDISYQDTLGATRQVSVPFVTTYVLYLLHSTNGNLSGGDWTTAISGILQQNENHALPLRLAQYAKLNSISLRYGQSPAGITSSAQTSVDTRSDTIAIDNVCFYENVTENNLKMVYDSKYLAPMLNTALTPAYHYASDSAQGYNMSANSRLDLNTGGDLPNLRAGAPEDRPLTDKYLVRIKTADIETAGTTGEVQLSLRYTTRSGGSVTTSEYSLSALTSGFYGSTFKGGDPKYQYQRHMRRNCRAEFVVELSDVATIDSVTMRLEGANEWQIEYIEVYALSSLEQRSGERSGTSDTGHLYWRRDFTGEMIATVRQDVLFYERANQHTILFTVFDENGEEVVPEQPVQTDEYLTDLPSSMTYEETLKNLGLAVPKYVYQVDVKVGDLQDAGSGNYFYFQLIFENGASGVVLANQQLASDSFRQGMTESFQIKTTQNYGNVRSVRIICDNTSSTSDVFDKLNIENINVTLSSKTGVSRSWVINRVGWIDITYADEGANNGMDGLDSTAKADSANVELVREFSVTGTATATAVDLLFCIATSKDSAGISNDGKMMSDPFNSALGASAFSAVLYYRDGNGQQQSYAFDLTAQIRAYNDTDKTFWLYRPTHMDRFTISLTDVQSITALEITRSGGMGVWKIDMVSVSQIGGLGDVFLSPAMEEYYREPGTETELTKGTNGQAISIAANSNATISFQENHIEVVNSDDNASWNTSISRIPDVTGETLNIYLYAGTLLGRSYTFQSGDEVTATLLYTSVYGGRPLQNSYRISELGEYNGEPVLYAKNLDISLMSSIRLLKLSSRSVSTSNQPTISHAVIERVKGGVLVDTYRFQMGNADLSSTQPEASISGTPAVSNMNQVVRLQLASGQSAKLTPETSDIAVALRYTTALDPAENKTVYQSPYFYLTDFTTTVPAAEGQSETRRLYNGISSNQIVDLPFDIDGIGEVVGLSVVSSGPNVSFDRAVVHNYMGDPANNAAATLDSSCYITDSFVSSSIPSVLHGQSEPVVPVTFRFTTPAEEIVAGAGTSGSVDMTVTYQDFEGSSRTTSLNGIINYLPEGGSFASGSTTEFTILMAGCSAVTGLSIRTSEDSWFINSAYAQVKLPDGTISAGETTVNNWARLSNALNVDIRPDSMRDDEVTGNQLLTFAVTGRGSVAGIPASAASGSSLQVTAYPGDTVLLTPTVTVQGEPDASWTWVPGELANSLIVNADGSAAFYISPSAQAGETYTFSVHCVGDQRLTVPITIAVEDPPPPPEPELPPDFGSDDWDSGDSGDTGVSDGGDSAVG